MGRRSGLWVEAVAATVSVIERPRRAVLAVGARLGQALA